MTFSIYLSSVVQVSIVLSSPIIGWSSQSLSGEKGFLFLGVVNAFNCDGIFHLRDLAFWLKFRSSGRGMYDGPGITC